MHTTLVWVLIFQLLISNTIEFCIVFCYRMCMVMMQCLRAVVFYNGVWRVEVLSIDVISDVQAHSKHKKSLKLSGVNNSKIVSKHKHNNVTKQQEHLKFPLTGAFQ